MRASNASFSPYLIERDQQLSPNFCHLGIVCRINLRWHIRFLLLLFEMAMAMEKTTHHVGASLVNNRISLDTHIFLQ